MLNQAKMKSFNLGMSNHFVSAENVEMKRIISELKYFRTSRSVKNFSILTFCPDSLSENKCRNIRISQEENSAFQPETSIYYS